MTFVQSLTGADPVIVEGLFKAPVERVWRAWTVPEEIRAWFGIEPWCVATAEVDLRVGGRWCFTFAPSGEYTQRLEGEYLEIEPHVRLVMSWAHLRDFTDGRTEASQESRVKIEFEAVGKATRVRLSHEGIVRQDGREGVGKGWEASFTNLEAAISKSKGAEA